jgi:hypothetical protein
MSGPRLTRQETRNLLQETLLWLGAVTEHLEHTTPDQPAPAHQTDPNWAGAPDGQTPPLLRHSLWNPWDRMILKRLFKAVDKGVKEVPFSEWRTARTAANQARQYRRQLQRSWAHRASETFSELAKVTVPEGPSQPSAASQRATAVDSAPPDAPEAPSEPGNESGEVQL